MIYDDCNPPEIETPDGLSDERLKPQVERLRSLRSAWGVLAPSCLTAQAREIAETGRAVTDLLASLSGRAGELDDADLATANQRLDDFEATMQKLIAEIPVSQFRSSLPGLIQTNRQGLLDLLDTMITGVNETKKGLSSQIGPLDYLTTLICTNAGTSDGQVRFDPVTLTSRMTTLCESVDTSDDARLSEIEAEFFAAANMDRDDLREEMQQRTLRSRKAELGIAFFAPRVLRAIITYNASLYHRVADEILDSGDWGLVDQNAEHDIGSSENITSIFASHSFRTIAAAARRRARGDEALPSDEDRIVSALDFDYLDKSEQRALTQTSVGSEEDLLGTAILFGLLCRSLAVLSIELQAVNISPDWISTAWRQELEAAFQEEINRKIGSDAYKAACALSELKNKFLLAPLTDQYREQRTTASALAVPRNDGRTSVTEPRPEDSAKTKASPAERPQRTAAKPKARSSVKGKAASKREPKRETALDLVRSALEEDQEPRRKQRGKNSTRFDKTAIKFASLGGLVLAFLVSFAVMNRNPDLQKWSTNQLESVSPYLESGHRNGEGTGPAFAGQIAHQWEGLPFSVREASAEDLVRRLREIGVEQIMVYGSDRRVRIQSIGSQPTQVR